jgi:hypothetical protein
MAGLRIAVMIGGFVLAGLTIWARKDGWFGCLCGSEALLVLGGYAALRLDLAAVRWNSLE